MDILKQIARVCHEANRAYCESLGDDSQAGWENAPDWQKDSAIVGVLFHLEHLRAGTQAPPSASHDSWLAEKKRQGWKFGPVKNPETKEHPCIVSYDQLPVYQRTKDYLFAAIVEAIWKSQQEEIKAALPGVTTVL